MIDSTADLQNATVAAHRHLPRDAGHGTRSESPRRFAVIEAPSALGHIPTHQGVARTPDVLLDAGLADRLRARRAARVPAPPYNPERDPETGILNPAGLREYSIALADAVTEVLKQGEFPIVLGGDCSILLGPMLALRRLGRYGLMYIDGDADFYAPEHNPILGAASASDVAFATGRGPDVVANIEGRRPLVRDEDVVVFANRDGSTHLQQRNEPLPESMLVLDSDQVRRLGVDTAIEEAVGHLTRTDGPAGYWVHFDADALDESIMRAVDDPRPSGLSWSEARTAIRIATHSPHALGLQITIYNPDLDFDGTSGRGLAATIVHALTDEW
jgi:arginase